MMEKEYSIVSRRSFKFLCLLAGIGILGAAICIITWISKKNMEMPGNVNMLKNSYVEFQFDENGCLTQIINLQTGHVWLNAADCGYEITVNVDTGNIWETTQGKEVILCPRDTVQEMSIEYTDDGQKLYICGEHMVNEGKVIVTQYVTLADNDTTATWSMEIDNGCTDATVTSVVPVCLRGLQDCEEPLDLLWPDKEGKLYTDVLTAESNADSSLSASYPSSMSMQYLLLYNDTESLYFGVHDATREYKDFAFESLEKGGTILCCQWPFVGAQSSKQLAPVCIGVLNGNWYEGADLYREYLISNGFAKNYSKIARNFTGIASCCLVRYSNQNNVLYTSDSLSQQDMASVSVDNQSTYGTPLTIYLGWHEKGFDSRYPDYEFLNDYGGENSFRQGVEEVHMTDGKAVMYLNIHIAETKSNWYNAQNEAGVSNGLACAIQTKYGSVLHETYGTGLDYIAMCPMAEAWQGSIVEAVERLRRNGADGLWLDQMMEMPSNLCYNKEHGHSTPATAYAQGYDSLMAKIDEVMSSYGDDYFYCCEGTCDAYIGYIDMCGLMWQRLPGSDNTTAWEITRYTMPTKFFGLPTFGTIQGTQAEYADAWVVADGMLCTNKNALIKRFSELANQYPDIYFDGRYLDKRSMSGLPDNVAGAVILGAEGNRAAIQLFNHTDSSITFTIALDTKELGTGECLQMFDAESGEMLEQTDSGWLFTINAERAAAVIAEFAEK